MAGAKSLLKAWFSWTVSSRNAIAITPSRPVPVLPPNVLFEWLTVACSGTDSARKEESHFLQWTIHPPRHVRARPQHPVSL